MPDKGRSVSLKIAWVGDHFAIPPSIFEKLNRNYSYFKDELVKMEMWYLANPKKRKRNILIFMVNWLNTIKKEKVVIRVRNDEQDWEKKLRRNELEVASPPAEWKDMLKKFHVKP